MYLLPVTVKRNSPIYYYTLSPQKVSQKLFATTLTIFFTNFYQILTQLQQWMLTLCIKTVHFTWCIHTLPC